MTYSCIIVDDEPLAHKVLKNHLKNIEYFKLTGEFYNAEAAKEFLASNHIDMMFLDIEMPGTKGIDFLRLLEEKPLTIFTTAFRDYALEGFELGVIDYLLKPISFERFEIAVERSAEFLDMIQTPDAFDEEEKKPDNSNYNIVIKTGIKKIMLDARTISHAQGLKDYTILFTPENRFMVKGSVKAITDFLPPSLFLRVHKSFIVAKRNIKLITKNKIEFEDISIPIGRSYKQEIDKFLAANNLAGKN
jgi:DNA-binding LytR/AlgR family response regulator